MAPPPAVEHVASGRSGRVFLIGDDGEDDQGKPTSFSMDVVVVVVVVASPSWRSGANDDTPRGNRARRPGGRDRAR